ncbi:hypothetical protein [Streptomyces sp. NRRL S-378]|uniref:hypothetical protein n=1 Tax=Streptomyces sp. NRRL S-378 TaxID=1463904 RepID=UPI000ACD9901|nr:hypothetical protein [Streptomyces sp. NRRL S-378]
MSRRIAEHPDPAVRDAHTDHVRDLVANGTASSLTDLVEAYGRPPAELAAASDPGLRAVVAVTWRDRPAAVQSALLTDPDPRVRAAATWAEHPGAPPEHHDRCLADPAVRADLRSTCPADARPVRTAASDRGPGRTARRGTQPAPDRRHSGPAAGQ